MKCAAAFCILSSYWNGEASLTILYSSASNSPNFLFSVRRSRSLQSSMIQTIDFVLKCAPCTLLYSSSEHVICPNPIPLVNCHPSNRAAASEALSRSRRRLVVIMLVPYRDCGAGLFIGQLVTGVVEPRRAYGATSVSATHTLGHDTCKYIQIRCSVSVCNLVCICVSIAGMY